MFSLTHKIKKDVQNFLQGFSFDKYALDSGVISCEAQSGCNNDCQGTCAASFTGTCGACIGVAFAAYEGS